MDWREASWLDICATTCRTLGMDEAFKKREREKARARRKSRWWQNKLQAGVCDYCSGTFDREELTMDHIVPVARGGRSVKGNVAVSCKQCNTEKKTSTPVEDLLSQLSNERGQE